MGEILVVAEHRMGSLRDITAEMLYKAGQLCDAGGHSLTAVVLAGPEDPFAESLVARADQVLACKDVRTAHFDNDLYKEVLCRLIRERKPALTLIGHTSWGMSLAPALAVRTGYPLATDCVEILLEDERPKVVRQIYGGKAFCRVAFERSEGVLVTVRPGAFLPPDSWETRDGAVRELSLPDDLPPSRRAFLDLADGGAGEVDISQADLLVSVGRGIGEEENIGLIRDLADRLGATLSCSRPIVDKNWLPKYHQVGTSGKSVRPKAYLALGISGAFQHVAGISGAGTVIAVNKDPKAPIFRVADYGVAEDLLKIVTALMEVRR